MGSRRRHPCLPRSRILRSIGCSAAQYTEYGVQQPGSRRLDYLFCHCGSWQEAAAEDSTVLHAQGQAGPGRAPATWHRLSRITPRENALAGRLSAGLIGSPRESTLRGDVRLKFRRARIGRRRKTRAGAAKWAMLAMPGESQGTSSRRLNTGQLAMEELVALNLAASTIARCL